MPQQLKAYIKTAEGRYTLVSDRPTNTSFNPSRVTRLTYASLPDGPEQGEYIIFNLLDSLHICRYNQTNKCRDLGWNAASQVPQSDLRATSKMEVGLLHSLVEEMAAPEVLPCRYAGIRSVTEVFNEASSADAARCVAVAWLEQTGGAAFISAHASGYLYLFHKGASEIKEGRSGAPKATARSPVLIIHASASGLTDAGPSPNGAYVASTARDGILRVHDLSTGVLVAGFKSYYGSLLCCCWTHDSRYVAAGGEDDLVSVYGMTERALVAWGSGHLSWVARVAFDSWLGQKGDPGTRQQLRTLSGNARSTQERVYRLASVGHDCRLLMWDLIVPSEGAFAGMSPGSPRQPSVSPQISAIAEEPVSRSSSGKLRIPRLGPIEAARGRHQRLPSSGSVPPEIAPSPSHLDMVFMPPVTQHKIHLEPLTDILFTHAAIHTACHGGCVKAWQRPNAQQAAKASKPAARRDEEALSPHVVDIAQK